MAGYLGAPVKAKTSYSLHYRRFCIRSFFFVGVDFAVILRIKRPVLGVQLLGRHGEDKAVLLAFKAGGVVAAIGVGHAFGERSAVNQFSQRRGETIVLLVEFT